MRMAKQLSTRRNGRARLRSEELEDRATPATITVNSLADWPDAVPGDGVADTQMIPGQVKPRFERPSMRETPSAGRTPLTSI